MAADKKKKKKYPKKDRVKGVVTPGSKIPKALTKAMPHTLPELAPKAMLEKKSPTKKTALSKPKMGAPMGESKNKPTSARIPQPPLTPAQRLDKAEKSVRKRQYKRYTELLAPPGQAELNKARAARRAKGNYGK